MILAHTLYIKLVFLEGDIKNSVLDLLFSHTTYNTIVRIDRSVCCCPNVILTSKYILTIYQRAAAVIRCSTPTRQVKLAMLDSDNKLQIFANPCA